MELYGFKRDFTSTSLEVNMGILEFNGYNTRGCN